MNQSVIPCRKLCWSDICSDRAGGVYAVLAVNNQNSTGFDVIAQRFDQSGAKLWGQDWILVSASAGTQTNPRVASDPAGNLVVAFQDGSLPSYEGIFGQRISPDGVVQWQEGGRTLIQTEYEEDVYDVIVHENTNFMLDGLSGARNRD
ncbi:MAG: hypothetical protein IPP40_12075 [bacterium]|nr:hypothetical protein [bacterium]